MKGKGRKGERAYLAARTGDHKHVPLTHRPILDLISPASKEKRGRVAGVADTKTSLQAAFDAAQQDGDKD